MKLTPFQKAMYDGEYGKGAQMAMNIQCAVGESFEAERMVPVERVHISLSAQDADIWFTERITQAGAKASVTPTVNPGFCPAFFTAKGLLDEDGIRRMERTEAAYKALGAKLTYSCTPYLFENIPAYGEACAFSETSVTVYCNSVIGAKTNRESSMSAACAAITGFVPEYGMLNEENRKPDILVEVEADISDLQSFSMLGLCGKKIGRGNPVFYGLPDHIPKEALIALGANLNISGTYDIFHIPGVTPDLAHFTSKWEPKRSVKIRKEDLYEAAAHYSYAPGDAADFVILGCPHYTGEQIMRVKDLLAGAASPVPVMILTSARLTEHFRENGLAEALARQNVMLIPDTCVDEVCCFKSFAGKYGLTDSYKAAYYMETFGVKLTVRDTAECLGRALAVSGRKEMIGEEKPR